MSNSTTETPIATQSNSWDTVAARRDLLEEIVEDDGPFAPDAKALLNALDERARESDP